MKNNLKHKKSLALNTETVRALRDDQLTIVDGGFATFPRTYGVNTCRPVGCVQ